MAQGEEEMTDSRNTILDALRKGKGPGGSAPAYALPLSNEDPVARFIAKAKASVAQVQLIFSPDDVPEAIFALLAAAGAKPQLHIPAVSPLNNLPWQRAPGLALSDAPPSGEDAAFSAADFGIGETGTLVFCSGTESPSSWHYRPGREIVLLHRAQILPRFEDVIARLTPLPATVNLVTGPSRTADIEQTIELGAHGPRSLHILLAGPAVAARSYA
jgi:L-lactate dehydrogenase complex protein LldG